MSPDPKRVVAAALGAMAVLVITAIALAWPVATSYSDQGRTERKATNARGSSTLAHSGQLRVNSARRTDSASTTAASDQGLVSDSPEPQTEADVRPVELNLAGLHELIIGLPSLLDLGDRTGNVRSATNAVGLNSRWDHMGMWVDREFFRDKRGGNHRSNTQPDGILHLWVRLTEFDGTTPAGGTLTARLVPLVGHSFWEITTQQQDSDRTFQFVVPLNPDDRFQVQIESNDASLALGHMPHPSVARSPNGSLRNLFRRNAAVNAYSLRMVAPDQQPRGRSILVTDDQGRPVSNATISQEAQEFGRTGADGWLRWPLPPVTPRPASLDRDAPWPHRSDLGFFLHAPGYTPIVIARGEVEGAAAEPLHVTLKAREIVASVWGGMIDERFLSLADISQPRDREAGGWARSDILTKGWDLLPLHPDSEVADWLDAYYYVYYPNRSKDAVRRGLEDGSSAPYRYSKQRSYYTRPTFDGKYSWTEGLAEATGRPYHELWPNYYGAWYNGRWKYDAGQFDVALPYPGKFLLLVGEEYREGMARSNPGQLNHVLYIDARDPGKATGQVFRFPD